MNNEIGRKITSLTLMTIMIAGSLTFAFPGVIPEAHAQANANLFVSVEESFKPDRFGGAMVVEVVVNDPNLKDTDEVETEPDVTVNGKDLRMVQATDGNWYAYFTDLSMAKNADKLATVPGTSLDFGKGCDSATAVTSMGPEFTGTFSDAEGVYVKNDNNVPDIPGTLDGACAYAPGAGAVNGTNVVREQKTLTKKGTGPNVLNGQIGVSNTAWPFIQLYSFTAGGDAKVVYNIGGGAPQTVTLEFDDSLDDWATISTDRSSYPQGADVHLTISDNWLNVDPTDEDSWTFGSNATNATTVYQAYDENGSPAGANIPEGTPDIQPNKTSINAGDLGALLITYNPNNAPVDSILDLFNNTDQAILESAFGPARVIALGTADPTENLGRNSAPVTIVETESSTGIFQNTDESDQSNIRVTTDAPRGTTATIDYNDSPKSILVANYFGTLNMDPTSLGGEWNSGEELPVLLTDQDINLNSRVDEDITLSNARFPLIPSLRIGSPVTLAGLGSAAGNVAVGDSIPDLDANVTGSSVTVDSFSDRANLGFALPSSIDAGEGLAFTTGTQVSTIGAFNNGTTQSKYAYLNYDLRTFEDTITGPIRFSLRDTILDTDPLATNNEINATNNGVNRAPVAPEFAAGTSKFNGLIDITNIDVSSLVPANPLTIGVNFTGGGAIPAGNYTLVIDFFSFGTTGDGNLASERFNNAIYRFELEETGDNTGQFEGTVEYIMLNQLNVNQTSTYTSIVPVSDQPVIIVGEDLTDEDSPRINYLDKGADGVSTQIADQQEAPTHSGVVSFDSSSYKVADTVTVTLEDQDLNTDVDTIGIFTVVRPAPAGTIGDAAYDTVGTAFYGSNSAGDAFGRLLDITFDDSRWQNFVTVPTVAGTCAALIGAGDDGLGESGFSLVETAATSGIFKGDFQVPASYCAATTTGAFDQVKSVTGVDMEVNYVDFRDASGEIIEVGDGAGIRANTGSVSLDRTVYPVPWGTIADVVGGTTKSIGPSGFSLFPLHATAISINKDVGTGGLDVVGDKVINDATDTLGDGDVVLHVRINDPDFDVSASGEDKISLLTNRTQVPGAYDGPVLIQIARGVNTVILGTAGGPAAFGSGLNTGNTITVGNTVTLDTREFGPFNEIAPDAGIFELDLPIRYTDGPADTLCPGTITTTSYLAGVNATRGNVQQRFSAIPAAGTNYCIQQGDIITVEYTDPTDASGDPNTVTDSATFDLRNGVLQSDKSVYIIGADMIMTVIEPDWDRDNDGAETYDLDAIEWDSDAATVSMGNAGGEQVAFDPEPSNLRETGDSTGIFQVVIEIPNTLAGDKLERGEEVVLEYTDWGPSGADYVGDDDEDINLTIFTSNFGATVELDQKVYSWTDKVYVTIVAPDHNFDSNLIDEIGDSPEDPIKVSTRGSNLDPYKLVETGTDTGIFTGEVILTGFNTHDADGDGLEGDASGTTAGVGPTDGFLASDDDDGITVSFEFSEDETVVGSALIRWNIGEVQWLEASYPATGTGVLRVVDPDMNLNPEAVDNFQADVWSDSDAGGIDLTVTETNEATGIFEGTVFFTVTDESSGHRLRVAEGDTITGEYEDNTLPDPYTTADELDITATSIIGTIVPPLERAPASGIRVVDAFGNSLAEVQVDQQVQITADLANGQDRDQPFAYLVQIQDNDGVTVSLAWITGSLTAGQSFSPALSWIPNAPGTYTATAFVWESVDNPTALSPPVKTTVRVV